jgi:hypothetical protein
MPLLTTVFQLLAVALLAYAMGIAVVKPLLPRDLEEQYGALIAPCAGYLALCLAAFTLSSAFDIGAPTAVWIAMGALLAGSAATQLRSAWRITPAASWHNAKAAARLVLPMALLPLAPFFLYGADTYLGSVNPDFFAGMVDDDYLLAGHSVITFESTRADSFYPIANISGHLAASARFGSGLFALAIKLVLGVETRTAFTLAIAFFMLCLPLSVYFLGRVAMQLEEKTAAWAAWLAGISAPAGMSYLYFYLGQNGGLPALPLVLTACYLMLVRPSAGTLVLAAILANALYVNYFAMLPWALAPAGALALYLLVTRRLQVVQALRLALGFVGITGLLFVGNVAGTIESLRVWLGVIGQSLQGQYFLDFLTEAFFYYFLGVYNYQSSPWAVDLMGQVVSRLVGFGVAVGVFIALVAFIRQWARQASRESRVLMVSALVIYTGVWWLYSFEKQYGYAVFKMSSWLQFVLVPFMAFGLQHMRSKLAAGVENSRLRHAYRAGLAACFAYIALNAAAGVQYAYNGLGRNTDTGYIVNHFDVSGNRDYFELREAAARYVKPDESIGLLFTDSIRAWWSSYYLKERRQSILAHDLIPGDDENLPDIETNVVVDYYGNVERLKATYFHGGSSDAFFMTGGAGDINHDIVASSIDAKPIWENRSFRLYRAADTGDILTTGRGFYRLEYFDPKPYFFPSVLRWSAEGGEFFLLRPRTPGGDYRLALDVLAGYEYPTDSRTLEFFLNGRKFDEVVITSSARVISSAFKPLPGANKLVVHVKERNRPLPRVLALWNADIPADYRRMNVAFSNARLLAPGSDSAPAAAPLGQSVAFLQLHPHAERFDGLQLDGWIGDRASLTMPVPAGAARVTISGFVPGNLRLDFPFTLRAEVNGLQTALTLAAPGPFELSAPLPGDSSTMKLVLLPQQSRLVGEEGLRHKVLRRSLRLDTLAFR